MCIGGGSAPKVPWQDPNYGQGGTTDRYNESRGSQQNFQAPTQTTQRQQPQTTEKAKAPDNKAFSDPASQYYKGSGSKLKIAGPNLNKQSSGGINV